MERQSARALRTTCHRDKLQLWLAEDTLLLVDESSMIPWLTLPSASPQRRLTSCWGGAGVTGPGRRRAAQVEKGTWLAYQTAARPCRRACPSPGRRVQVLGVTEECLWNCMGASLPAGRRNQLPRKEQYRGERREFRYRPEQWADCGRRRGLRGVARRLAADDQAAQPSCGGGDPGRSARLPPGDHRAAARRRRHSRRRRG